MTQTTTEPPVYEKTFAIRAARGKIWDALTDERAVSTWFAERARIEARVGGAYRFWGKHTPTFGLDEPGDQTITALEPGERLAFDWTWAGQGTHAELRLEDGAEAGQTMLHVHHRLERPLASYDCTESCWLADDFWSLAAGNLEQYCRTGMPALLPDHSIQGGTVELSIEIEAPADAVWRGLTVPDEIATWLCDSDHLEHQISVDLRAGGVYSFGWERDGKSLGPQRILELEVGKRLVYSWTHAGDATDRTEWVVEPLGADRTRLTVRQFGTASVKESSGYANGWASFMVAFKRSREDDAGGK